MQSVSVTEERKMQTEDTQVVDAPNNAGGDTTVKDIAMNETMSNTEQHSMDVVQSNNNLNESTDVENMDDTEQPDLNAMQPESNLDAKIGANDASGGGDDDVENESKDVAMEDASDVVMASSSAAVNDDSTAQEQGAPTDTVEEKFTAIESGTESGEVAGTNKALKDIAMKEPPHDDTGAAGNSIIEQEAINEIDKAMKEACEKSVTVDSSKEVADEQTPVNEAPKDSIDRSSATDPSKTIGDTTHEAQDTNTDEQIARELQNNDDSIRRIKRRRSSLTNRYSPGEGGGLKKHKADGQLKSPESSSQIVNNVENVENVTVEKASEGSKKKEAKKTKSHESSKQFPIYTWADTGEVQPSSKTITHQALSIDFGPFSSDDAISPTAAAAPAAQADDGTWKCTKCHHSNKSTKMRCGVCLSWKGGKRENYSRRSSVDSTCSVVSVSGNTSQPLVVRVGDDVLISSGSAPWKELNRLVARAELLKNKQSEKALRGEEEVSICYNDPVSNEPGLAVLDPYVARVEGMWEEMVDDLSGKEEGVAKMMIQTRWYFKREDMEGLQCNLLLDGEADVKERIVADMTVRDLILSDQVDVNSASCILGKTNIAMVNPDMKNKVKGGFVCRYKLNLDGDGVTGTLFPMVNSGDVVDLVQPKQVNRHGSDAVTGSSEDETEPSRDEAFPSAAFDTTMPPRRVISEGTTMGKIKVGPDHQAFVSNQVDLEKESSSLANQRLDREPVMVWNPTRDEGNIVDEFINQACSIIMKSMTETPFHESNYVESPDPNAEASKPREISIDCLLAQLHECQYNSDAALEKVSADPKKFLTVWKQSERDQFDSCFRVYRDSLRMIASNLVDSKSCKDVIEYHYRFKLVENFRRFKAKKLEQAREMMETVEYRMLQERRAIEARNDQHSEDDNLSSDDDGRKNNNVPGVMPAMASNKAGPVNSRIRTWFKTGCSKTGEEGATQLRRNRACRFLIEVKNQVGIDAYVALAKCLKSYNAHSQSSLFDLKASAQDIMKSHPALFDQFVNDFLPKEIC